MDGAVNGLASRLIHVGFYPVEAFCLAQACYIDERKRSQGVPFSVLGRKQATAEVNSALAALRHHPGGEEGHLLRILLWEKVFGRGTWPEPISADDVYSRVPGGVAAKETNLRSREAWLPEGRDFSTPNDRLVRTEGYGAYEKDWKERVFLSVACAVVLTIIVVGIAFIFISEGGSDPKSLADTSDSIGFLVEADSGETCPSDMAGCWIWRITPDESCSDATVSIELSRSETAEGSDRTAVYGQKLIAGSVATVIASSDQSNLEYAAISSIVCEAP